jgi:hypothetical protein
MPVRSTSSILWSQVLGVAFVQGAISLCWLIYSLYIPAMLVSAGLDERMAVSLVTIENFLAAGIEPVMGGLSDRWQVWLGTKMPLIAAGAIASAGLFILLPLSVTLAVPNSGTWLVGLAVAWAIAMAVFRTPVVSLLGNLACGTGLAPAASILTLVGGLVSAARFLATKTILGMGSPVAFGIGSGVLIASVLLLRSLMAKRPSVISDSIGRLSPIPWIRVCFLLIVGTAMGWGLRCTVAELLPRLLAFYAPDQLDWGMAGAFMAMALFGVVSAQILAILSHPQRYHGASAGGLILVVVSIWLFSLNLSFVLALPVAIALTAGLGVAVNTLLPMCLEFLPTGKGGLALGCYFGGIGLANALYSLLLQATISSFTLVDIASMCQVAFVFTGIAVAVARRY